MVLYITKFQFTGGYMLQIKCISTSHLPGCAIPEGKETSLPTLSVSGRLYPNTWLLVCLSGVIELYELHMLVQLAIGPARLAPNDFGNSNELQVAQRSKESNLCQTCVCPHFPKENMLESWEFACVIFSMIHIQLSPKTCGQEGLMPKIVSGVSGGSIVAGFLAIHTDEEKLGWIWTGRCQKSLFWNREVWSYSPRFRSAHRSEAKVISYSGTWKLWLGREPLYKGTSHESMWKQRLFKFMPVWGKGFQNGAVHVASWAETTIKLVREMADWFSQDWIPQHPTRWAPTSYKWRYGPYK